MKVLLLKDVFKLGRAGDVKRVADGYGRNYLLPQGLAVLATSGALKQVDRIKVQATIQRDALNEELGTVAEQLNGIVLTFTARASETSKLYGSINQQMIAEAITEKIGVEINRQQVYTQPLRTLGEHKVEVRLTVDLVPEVTVIINSEGEELEAPEMALDAESPTEAVEDETLTEAIEEETLAEVGEEETLAEADEEETLAEAVEEETPAESEPEASGEDVELDSEGETPEEIAED